MFIIFNKDGSIYARTQSDYVMQGSNRVNKVFVGFVDNNYADWSCAGVFTLPNQTRKVLPAQIVSGGFDYLGQTYQGWVIELTSDITKYAGTVKMSVEVVYASPTILYTYLSNIIINETGYPLDGEWDESLTVGQFNDYLAQLSVKLQANTVSVEVRESDLPAVGEKNILYFIIGETSETPYQVKMWNGSRYVPLGTINLSSFASKEEQLQFEEELQEEFNEFQNTLTGQNQLFQNSVNAQISQIRELAESSIGGSPKGVYDSVDALTSAFPTGNDNVYLVGTNWYYWNGNAWTVGGAYLSSEGAVGYKEINSYATQTLTLANAFPGVVNDTFEAEKQVYAIKYLRTNNTPGTLYIRLSGQIGSSGYFNIKVYTADYYQWADLSANRYATTTNLNTFMQAVESALVYYMDANKTPYDNATSGLDATNVQDAIDETNTKIIDLDKEQEFLFANTEIENIGSYEIELNDIPEDKQINLLLVGGKSNNILGLTDGDYDKDGTSLVVGNNGLITYSGTNTQGSTILIPLLETIEKNQTVTLTANYDTSLGNYNDFITLRNSNGEQIGSRAYLISYQQSSTFELTDDAVYLGITIRQDETRSGFTLRPHVEIGSVAQEYSYYGRTKSNIKVYDENNIEVFNDDFISTVGNDIKIVSFVSTSNYHRIIFSSNYTPNIILNKSKIGWYEEKQNIITRLETIKTDASSYNLRYPTAQPYNSGGHLLINVNPGEKYLITGTCEATVAPCAFVLNENDTGFYKWFDEPQTSYINKLIVIPEGAKKLVINTNYVADSFRGTTRPYAFKVIDTPKFDGKKIGIFLGDSVVQGFGVLLSQNSSNGLISEPPVQDGVSICANLLEANIYNGGIGGSSFINRSGIIGCIRALISRDFADIDTGIDELISSNIACTEVRTQWDKIKQLDMNNVDFICISCGTNDFSASRTLENIDNPLDDETVLGCLRLSIKELAEAYPNINVYVFTPTFRFFNTSLTPESDSDIFVNNTGKTLPDYVDGIINTCKELKIPCCDIYRNSGFNKYNFTNYFIDYVHPNKRGYYLLGQKWAKFINSN